MTVLVGADPGLHEPGWLNNLVRFCAGSQSGRIDKIAIPDVSEVGRDEDVCSMVAEDVAATVDLHRVRRVLVVTYADQDPRRIIAALKEQACLAARTVEFLHHRSALTSSTVPRRGTVVLRCVEPRLSGDQDNLASRIRQHEHGVQPAVISLVGGAANPELCMRGHRRQRVFMRWIEQMRGQGMSKFLGTAHEDCGRLGGNDAFQDIAHQHEHLDEAMDTLARMVRTVHNDLPVENLLVHVNHHAMTGVSIRRRHAPDFLSMAASANA